MTGGWNIFEQSSSNHQWSLYDNLPIVQVNFGVHPFFKVSIEDGNITLSEGELGLPDEQLYFLHRDHPVSRFIFSIDYDLEFTIELILRIKIKCFLSCHQRINQI